MVRHPEKKVLLGVRNGSEIPGTDAIQYKIMAAPPDIYGAIYKSFDVFGDYTLWDKCVSCAWRNIFYFIKLIDDRICSIRCDRYSKEQKRSYVIKNAFPAGSLTYCERICLCIRHVSWFLYGTSGSNKTFMEREVNRSVHRDY